MKIKSKIASCTGAGKSTIMIRLLAAESHLRKVFFISDGYSYDVFNAKLANDEIVKVTGYNVDNVIFIETSETLDLINLDFDKVGEFSVYDDTMCGHTKDEVQLLAGLYSLDNCKGLYTAHQLDRNEKFIDSNINNSFSEATS